MFHIYVNGNEVHDAGEHDAQGRVIRNGGGRLEFKTKEEGEIFANTLFANETKEAMVVKTLSKFRELAPSRESYVVSETPPISN